MKVVKVSASFGVTRSTGTKFEFDRLDASVEATLETGESAQEVIDHLQSNLQSQVQRQLMALEQKRFG